jgi:LysM domain-containing protein
MRTLILALLMVSTLWAQAPQAPTKTAPQQGPPPKNLTVRPDGHVSANQDPVNPEKFEVYVVKKGDTLSMIAGQVLKNIRLWPQLWEQNEHIINPHWIYPDDKILIRPVIQITEAKPPEPEPAPEPEPPPPPPVAETRRVQPPPPQPPPQPAKPVLVLDQQKPVSEIKFEDLYCSGFIRTSSLPQDLKVVAKFDTTVSVLAADTDYVYISHGSEDGVAAGSRYQVVRPTKAMTNPLGRTAAERNLGMHYLDIGQLTVMLVQPDFSLARITHVCGDAVDVGDYLLPFRQIVVPQPPRPRPFSPSMTTTSGIRGTIVGAKSVLLNFGSTFKPSQIIPGVRDGRLGPLERGIAADGDIVYIDIGQDKAVNPGDVFIVYRYSETDNRLYSLPREADRVRNTRTAIGELIVVKVGERAASAVVSYATDALAQGDAVERR